MNLCEHICTAGSGIRAHARLVTQSNQQCSTCLELANVCGPATLCPCMCMGLAKPYKLMFFTRSLAAGWLMVAMKRSNDTAATDEEKGSSSADILAALRLQQAVAPTARRGTHRHWCGRYDGGETPARTADSKATMATALAPFHLAFPVHDIQAAREFYLE